MKTTRSDAHADATAEAREKSTEHWTEGLDYVIDEQGRYIMTERYLLARGYCCSNGCMHCPYGNAPRSQETLK